MKKLIAYESLRRYYPLFGLLAVAFIYFFFNINVHTWESYAFAGSIEGFYNLLFEHSIHNPRTAGFPDFQNYHPNHPLLHSIVFLIYSFLTLFGLEVNSLFLVQTFNILFSLGALSVWYFIMVRLSKSRLFAFLSILICAFTNVFWYQGQSGEVYAGPFFFLSLCFFMLINFEETIKRGKTSGTYPVCAGLFWGIATGFHILSAAFIVVVLYHLVMTKKRFKKESGDFNLIRVMSAFSLAGGLAGIAVYVIPFLTLYKVSSITEYYHLIGIYSDVFGLWTLISNYNPGVPGLLVHIWFSIGSVMKALIIGNGRIFGILRYALFLPFAFFSIKALFFPEKNRFLGFLLIWFWWYFITIALIIFLQDVNDYWLYNIVPFIMFLLLKVKTVLTPEGRSEDNHRLAWRKVILPLVMAAIVLLSFIYNFYYEIFPKARIQESTFYQTAGAADLLENYNSFLVITDPGDLVMPEFWYLGRLLKKRENPGTLKYIFNKDSYFPALVGAKFEEDLQKVTRQLANETDEFILISDKSLIDTSQIEKNFAEQNYSAAVLFDKPEEAGTKYYKKACGDYINPVMKKNLIVYLFSRSKKSEPAPD